MWINAVVHGVTYLSGGSGWISADEIDTGDVLSDGARLTVYRGGTAIGVTLFGVDTWVYDYGVVSDAIVNSGAGILIGSGGTSINATLNDPTPNSGPPYTYLWVSAGGTAIGTIVNGGEIELYGFASGTSMISGYEYVNYGATDINATVQSGSWVAV